jgi:hypothetical protein
MRQKPNKFYCDALAMVQLKGIFNDSEYSLGENMIYHNYAHAMRLIRSAFHFESDVPAFCPQSRQDVGRGIGAWQLNIAASKPAPLVAQEQHP